MKTYFEVRIPLDAKEDNSDVLIALLSELGFDGFIEEEGILLAYCEKKEKSDKEIGLILEEAGIVASQIIEIKDENWNATWEAGYESVTIADRVSVRAPFHPSSPLEYDIVIEPKMSFGTAHHETTSLMLEFVLSQDFNNMKVLDMGSGTGVLAILAFLRGAREVTAIDNDEWAYHNACDNVRLNNASDIVVEMGDASSINSRTFNIIFANINRNILLRDIAVYSEALEKGGSLLLSGFYKQDLEQIQEKCAGCGLTYVRAQTKNKWTAAVFLKD